MKLKVSKELNKYSSLDNSKFFHNSKDQRDIAKSDLHILFQVKADCKSVLFNLRELLSVIIAVGYRFIRVYNSEWNENEYQTF